MKKIKKIFQHNFWDKKTDERVNHTAQSVLGLSKSVGDVVAENCGAGSCNCGGGCNGECGAEQLHRFIQRGSNTLLLPLISIVNNL